MNGGWSPTDHASSAQTPVRVGQPRPEPHRTGADNNIRASVLRYPARSNAAAIGTFAKSVVAVMRSAPAAAWNRVI